MKSDFSKKFSKPVFKRDVPDDSFKYQPAPEPSGKYPYHLDLESIDPVPDQNKLSFHMVGDTGSIRTPDFQKLVVGEMVKQFEATEKTGYEPQFLFHLGDVVYNFEISRPYFCDPGKSRQRHQSRQPRPLQQSGCVHGGFLRHRAENGFFQRQCSAQKHGAA
jgi:hypothetical protein